MPKNSIANTVDKNCIATRIQVAPGVRIAISRLITQLSLFVDGHNHFRRVPVNPNMDNLKTQTIQNPIEIARTYL